MYIKETIQKHSTNNTKHSKNKHTYYHNTHTLQNKLKYHTTSYTPNEIPCGFTQPLQVMPGRFLVRTQKLTLQIFSIFINHPVIWRHKAWVYWQHLKVSHERENPDEDRAFLTFLLLSSILAVFLRYTIGASYDHILGSDAV